MPENPYFTGHPATDAPILHQGLPVDKVMHQGIEIYPRTGPVWKDLPLTRHRIVEDGGKKFFEFGFVSKEILAGNSAIGWTDPLGFAYLFLSYSTNLLNWALGKFVPAPVPVETEGENFLYWSRMINPIDAEVKFGTGIITSTNGTGDTRNHPFTSMTIAGVNMNLPNFPYEMPGDASQLQADLRASGHPAAVVVATTNVDWQIVLPDLVWDSYGINTWVGWPPWIYVDPIGNQNTMYKRDAYGTFLDEDGNEITPKAFARLGVQSGPRFGRQQITYPQNPVFVQPPWELAPPPGTTLPPVFGPSKPHLLVAPGPITGSHAPGATLTRPTIVWGAADSVAGTWVKNGVATAATGETYSDTADGDVIQYREIAANEYGSSLPATTADFAVSSPAAAFLAEVHAGMAALATGKSGAAHMNVFSSLNHTAGTYTRNLSSWAASLIPQLTGVVAWKGNGTVESYGGVLITPRHVLYCRHAHPHAEGTWIYPSPPMTVRFVLADNSVVNAIQLAQSAQPNAGWTPEQLADGEANIPGFVNLMGQTSRFGMLIQWPIDLCVAILDRDMDALGVHVVPLADWRSQAEWMVSHATGVPSFGASQAFGRATNSVPPTPISDYPQQHQAMHYIRQFNQEAVAPFNGLDYQVWDGDSGTPTFLLHRGVVYLDRILTTSPWGGMNPVAFIDQVNQMIAAADAGAIKLGRLAEPTGLTVAPVTLPWD